MLLYPQAVLAALHSEMDNKDTGYLPQHKAHLSSVALARQLCTQNSGQSRAREMVYLKNQFS